MARVTPEQFAAKWARRTSAATQDYQDGVKRVRTAPGELAAQKEEKLVANFQAAVQEGKWRERVAGVSLTEWQNAAITKGSQRIAAGVQGAQGDMQSFGRELLAAVDGAKAEVDQMPDLTLEDRIQKSVAFQRRMAQFRRSS